jgi:antitoxin (DNA-binding transcriptional repressor) of toxin-antitoxin stability system
MTTIQAGVEPRTALPGGRGTVARTIAQRDLRNEKAKVIDAVTAGETFVVVRIGEPVAELRPIRAGRRTLISRDMSPPWRVPPYASTIADSALISTG